MVTPLKANMFHSGSTCPFCQEAITEGQQIIICPDCGCIQHDLCWGHNNGCASYHCDNKVTTTQPNFIPELTITSEELDEIIIPPKLALALGHKTLIFFRRRYRWTYGRFCVFPSIS